MTASRPDFARRLALLVSVSGLLIALVGIVAIMMLRERTKQSAHEALRVVADQSAQRIGAYLAQQHEMLRAIAMAIADEPDSERRLAEVPLDAPSMGRLVLVDEKTPSGKLPPRLEPGQVVEALNGREVASAIFLAPDLTPAMDLCVPAGNSGGRAVCATLDLLELQRQVQRIRIGEQGLAIAFDADGHVLAAGAGTLRAAVLTGAPVAESPLAVRMARGQDPPQVYKGGLGDEVIAGWARLPEQGWTIAVEQPTREVLRAARDALLGLSIVAVTALLSTIALGVAQSRRMLTSLEIEERWRTAGRIATGITHDLGHRVALLQSTAALAETGNPAYLPLIRDNLRSETVTLKKFVSDFADLSREVEPEQFLPLELNAFAESVLATAAPEAEKAEMHLDLRRADQPAWIRGDRYLLERAVLNLVNNAIEASPHGGVVELSVSAHDERAKLTVTDHGMGIAKDRLERIFDAFASTKRTGAHIGMGLPNVRRIVRAHGGEVSVESEPGRSSSFRIELPLAPPPPPRAQP